MDECHEFLDEIIELLEGLKFGSRHLPSQSGAVWASVAIRELMQY